jgi:hypothetical protein
MSRVTSGLWRHPCSSRGPMTPQRGAGRVAGSPPNVCPVIPIGAKLRRGLGVMRLGGLLSVSCGDIHGDGRSVHVPAARDQLRLSTKSFLHEVSDPHRSCHPRHEHERRRLLLVLENLRNPSRLRLHGCGAGTLPRQRAAAGREVIPQ